MDSWTSVPVVGFERWPQRLLPADDGDAKVHVGLRRKLLPDAGQSQNQIRRVKVGRTETLNSVAALLYPVLRKLENLI
jgi:hypothetical protein